MRGTYANSRKVDDDWNAERGEESCVSDSRDLK